ncbi:MAG: NADH:ubiquinone reductase (Na(+)-transporting) subunit F [Steroidobacteraceae bacterium]
MGYDLTIEPLGQTIHVEDGQTIHDAALRAGIYLPHACCHGLCATCKVDVVDGEVDHGEASTFALMDFEREEGKTLACCAHLESDTVIEAEIDEDVDARNLPVQDYDAEVLRVEALTPTIRGIWLKLDRPMEFQAGQYVNIEVPDLAGQVRAFSLASVPADSQTVELNVRIVPGGRVTTWLHESLQPGQRLKISGPYGRFFVKRSANVPMLFMAGGSGLSSPKSMIEELLAEGCTLPMTLVYGQRSRDELYYHDRFTALAARHPNFSYVPALSNEPEGSDWKGARGFVHEAAAAHFKNDFRGYKAYLCGPPAMIEACIGTLMQGRLFERDIYMEKFFSAADAAQQVKSPLFRNI